MFQIKDDGNVSEVEAEEGEKGFLTQMEFQEEPVGSGSKPQSFSPHGMLKVL